MNIHEGSFVSSKPEYVGTVINALTVDSLIRLFDTNYNSINERFRRQKTDFRGNFQEMKTGCKGLGRRSLKQEQVLRLLTSLAQGILIRIAGVSQNRVMNCQLWLIASRWVSVRNDWSWPERHKFTFRDFESIERRKMKRRKLSRCPVSVDLYKFSIERILI